MPYFGPHVEEPPAFYLDDVVHCVLTGRVGVVVRVVDEEDDGPDEEYLKPPPGHVTVNWFPKNVQAVVHESMVNEFTLPNHIQIFCIERALSVGDVVKRATSITGDSGVVTDVRTFASVVNESKKFSASYVSTRRLKYGSLSCFDDQAKRRLWGGHGCGAGPVGRPRCGCH